MAGLQTGQPPDGLGHPAFWESLATVLRVVGHGVRQGAQLSASSLRSEGPQTTESLEGSYQYTGQWLQGNIGRRIMFLISSSVIFPKRQALPLPQQTTLAASVRTGDTNLQPRDQKLVESIWSGSGALFVRKRITCCPCIIHKTWFLKPQTTTTRKAPARRKGFGNRKRSATAGALWIPGSRVGKKSRSR